MSLTSIIVSEYIGGLETAIFVVSYVAVDAGTFAGNGFFAIEDVLA